MVEKCFALMREGRGSRRWWAAGLGVAVTGLIVLIPSSFGYGYAHRSPSGGSVVVDRGHIGVHHWFVVAAADGRRRGICLEVGVFDRTPRSGVDGGGQCSAPAARRGIVLTATKSSRGRDLPSITVVGGAFNTAVKRVEAVSFDGRTATIPLRRLKGREANRSSAGDFRYMALAVPGPWCVEHLVTYGADGKELWAAEFDELGREKSIELRLREARQICPRSSSS